MLGGIADGTGKVLTIDDLVEALDRRERSQSNVPKFDTFHFDGERVSDWLDLVEQALVGLSDAVKFQRISKYMLHGHHQEVEKVVNAANGSWARFKNGVQRKYRLGDDLLTIADLGEADKPWRGQCEAHLGHYCQRSRGRKSGPGGAESDASAKAKEERTGCDRLRDPRVKRIVTDILAELGYGKDAVIQKKVVTTIQGKGKDPMIEEAVQEDWEEEEPVPRYLSKAPRKQRNLTHGGQGSGKGQGPQAVVVASPSAPAPSSSTGPSQAAIPLFGQWPWPVFNTFVPWGSPTPFGQMVPYAGPQARMPPPSYPAAQAQPMAPAPSPAPSSQGSVAGGGNQGQGNQGNGGRGSGRGRGRNGGGRGGQWDNQGYQGQGNQGSQGSGRSRFDWRTAICQHCDKQGHTIQFCNTRREDERAGLICSNMGGDIYDQFGEYIDRKVPDGVRAAAQTRIATQQAPPAIFRLWQEKDDPPIRVEEVESDEEVTQRLRAGVIKEEPIVVESEEENENEKVEPASILLGKMEDLWGKMGRYQQKLVDICEEVRKNGTESEDECRRLLMEPEEEERGEALSLSLSDVNKAMDVVATHEMADPNAIHALREEVLECPQAGELELVYRLPGGRRDLAMMKAQVVSRPCLGDGSSRVPIDKKCRPVLVHITEDEEVYYERERGLIQRMREQATTGSCRINGENEEQSIVGESEFLLPRDRALMIEFMKKRHRAYAFDYDQGGRLDVDKIPIIRIHIVPHEPWNLRGAQYPNPDEEKKVVDYLDGKIHVRSFLDTCGFWRTFVNNFAAKTEHLRKLVRQDQEWIWGEEQEKVVARMKEEFRGGLVLGAPDYDLTEGPAEGEGSRGCTPGGLVPGSRGDVRLHIHEWSLRVPNCIGHPIGIAPRGYEQKAELVLKSFEEEDPWGDKNDQRMMKLALAGTHSLVEKVRTIEEGSDQVEKHEELMGGMYLLVNTLLQGNFDQISSLNPTENEDVVPESQNDEFEEGEIKEVFCAEEYEGIYLELGLLLSCEMRDRDASERAKKMRHLYLVRDGHLFVKRQMGNPRRVVCGRNRQIDIIVALHDGIARGHR
ncbi:hypothetical protein CBR_g30879 [Chara braunii]|uniref:Integrase zinc-binding domain-containing protein n=1 Tax=Chara braunii TaxID=69332 RepID=A0A388LDN0_CHABU|nr:hypothetical protein CBR_g30879 [Chara braunii]|eukprot:GBG80414.1 hypothetical protein CBR_g30879 [Chara braunii]